MPYFSIDIDFEVYCDICGSPLCNSTRVDNQRKRIYIEPCSRCLENKEKEITEKYSITF